MIIGRKEEQKKLLQTLQEDESQFLAIYGRRRVGKTFLIRETFKNSFAFQHSGLSNATKNEQIKEFCSSLKRYGLKNFKPANDWFDAFNLLIDLLESKPEGKKVVFIDELPWLDTHKSRFLVALEHFWNGWASARNDIVLIVCGSATSWIIKKVIRNRGGLHNRVNRQISLKPFTLAECKQYAEHRQLPLSEKDILEAYMIFGGIPFYWSFLQRDESLPQSIDRMFFAEQAELSDEFSALYESLFRNAHNYISIVKALSTIKAGMTRAQLLTATKMSDNITFKTAIEELEECGFIRRYQAFGKKKKDFKIQLIDNFTLFYYQFMHNNRQQDDHFWEHIKEKSAHSAWAGIAFERLCLWHVPQIKKALGISGIQTSVYSWTFTPNHDEVDAGLKGGQIDLIIDRHDGIVNLCEMKFYDSPVSVTAEYANHIRLRNAIFKDRTNCSKGVINTLVTTFGLVPGRNSDVFAKTITMENLLEQ